MQKGGAERCSARLHRWACSHNVSAYRVLPVCLPLSESVHVDQLVEFLHNPGWRGERLIIYHIRQPRKLRLREVKCLAQGHRTGESRGRDLNPMLLTRRNATTLEPGMSTRWRPQPLCSAPCSLSLASPSVRGGVSYSLRSLVLRQGLIRVARLENTTSGYPVECEFRMNNK